jgi:hypothetical protein
MEQETITCYDFGGRLIVQPNTIAYKPGTPSSATIIVIFLFLGIIGGYYMRGVDNLENNIKK